MHKILFLFSSLFFLNAHAADLGWTANKKCIHVIDKLDVLPSGYNLVALENGGIVLISSGRNGSIVVVNGKQEALSKGMYPYHVLSPNGSCEGSRVNQNGKEYLGTSLYKLLSSKTPFDMQKASELIEACKDAPAFSETVATSRSFFNKRNAPIGNPGTR